MYAAATPLYLNPSGSVTLTHVPENLVPPAIAKNHGYHFKNKRNNEETEALVQKALRDAWEQYGPKTPIQKSSDPLPPGAWRLPDGHPPTFVNPNNFQPVTSEWDSRLTTVPTRNRPVMQPGVFNRLLSRYVELEVNNHEITDFFRRVVVGIFLGMIALGWICLGLVIGFIPFKIFGLALGKRDLEGKDFASDTRKSDSVGNAEFGENDIMRRITERVFLALDGDWLQKLEQKVKKGNNGRWLKTHVHCCIMPDAKAKGTAECQLIRKARKVSSPFKCLSDLIYDIQFGPEDTPTSSNATSSTTS